MAETVHAPGNDTVLSTIELALVSASAAFREKAARLISGARDIRVTRIGSSIRTLDPDHIRADLWILHLDSLPSVAELPPGFIARRFPVLFVSAFYGEAAALANLLQSAWGWIPPRVSPEVFQAAVRSIRLGLVSVYASGHRLEGQSAGRSGLAESVRPSTGSGLHQPDAEAEYVRLSVREQEILELVCEGYRNGEIAGLLGISENTVKFHLSGLYERLGVSGRAEAVREGIRLGLLSV